MESEAHGPEKESLSGSSLMDARTGQWVGPFEQVCAAGRDTLLCTDRTSDDGMMAPLSSGVVKVLFLHVLQPTICLQTEEQVRAQRRAEELDKQKRAAEEAEITNAEKQVRLSVWIILVHLWNHRDAMIE